MFRVMARVNGGAREMVLVWMCGLLLGSGCYQVRGRSHRLAPRLVEVEAPPPADDLTSTIKARLRADPLLAGYPIAVNLDSGVVVLHGLIDRLLVRRRAVEVVRATPDVRAVVDRLEIVAPPCTAGELHQEVVHALASSPEIRQIVFQVQVNGGSVILDGTVGSMVAWQLADEAAAGVRGVTTLVNRIVAYPAGSSSTTVLASPGAEVASVHQNQAWAGQVALDSSRDTDCERAVMAAFARDDRIPSWPQPQIYVQSGHARLFGAVPTLLATRAAGEDAANARCVLHVTNQLEVEPTRLVNDEEIEDAAEQAIAVDAYLRGAAITVHVSEGEVLLTGTVNAVFQVERVALAAAAIQGTKAVRPRLSLAR